MAHIAAEHASLRVFRHHEGGRLQTAFNRSPRQTGIMLCRKQSGSRITAHDKANRPSHIAASKAPSSFPSPFKSVESLRGNSSRSRETFTQPMWTGGWERAVPPASFFSNLMSGIRGISEEDGTVSAFYPFRCLYTKYDVSVTNTSSIENALKSRHRWDTDVAPIRVLCLHGKGETGGEFCYNTEFLDDFEDGDIDVSWEYINAPFAMPHDPLKACEWWKLPPGERSFTATAYEAIIYQTSDIRHQTSTAESFSELKDSPWWCPLQARTCRWRWWSAYGWSRDPLMGSWASVKVPC
eukprot:1181102-Prorocentrum_minimum.AAC.2